MLKRQTAAHKTVRKRKKGNTTYSIGSLDPPVDNKTIVEEIRAWDVSTSQRTGRVSASRRTIKHYHQVSPSELENSLTSKQPEEHEDANIEEVGILTDPESPPEISSKHPKPKRPKAPKENDSVSELLALLALSP